MNILIYAKLRGRRGAESPPARTGRSPTGRGRGLPNFSPMFGLEKSARGASLRGAEERLGLSPKPPSGLRA